MFEATAVLRVKTEDKKIHSYYCPQDSNLHEVHDVLVYMASLIKQKIEQAEEQKAENEEPEKE